MSNDAQSQNQSKLSQEDIEAILDAWENRFYKRVGKGFWNFVVYGAMVVCVTIAGFGAYHKG